MSVLQDLLVLSMGSEPICDCPLSDVNSPRGLAPVPNDVDTFKEPEVRMVEVHRQERAPLVSFALIPRQSHQPSTKRIDSSRDHSTQVQALAGTTDDVRRLDL